MRANPAPAAAALVARRSPPVAKTTQPVLVSGFGAVLQFCFGCCPIDTTFRRQRDYNCVLFESQGVQLGASSAYRRCCHNNNGNGGFCFRGRLGGEISSASLFC